MTIDREAVARAIRAKVVELGRELGRDARSLRLTDSIPASGVLDSAGIMALMVWYEAEFGLSIEPEAITVDNFGTIERMVAYLETQP